MTEPADLSEAVELFLQRFPLPAGEAFTARFPDPNTRSRVQQFLDEALTIPPPGTSAALSEIGADVRTAMRERHPELSDEAVRRLGNYVAYLMR